MASNTRIGAGMLRVGLASIVCVSGEASAASVPVVERLADGVALIGERRLEVRACRDDIVRVLDAPPGPFFARESLVTVPGGLSDDAVRGPDERRLPVRRDEAPRRCGSRGRAAP